MSVLKGEFISKADATEEINEFLGVREKAYYEILNALNNSNKPDEVLNYFEDREVAFFFDFDLVRELQDMTAPQGANGILVYYGAAPSADTDLGIRHGSTTVVLVPARIETIAGNISVVKNIIVDNDKAAVQYPGGFVKDSIRDRVGDLLTFFPDRTTNRFS